VCVPDATVARVFESLLKPCGYETERCADGIDAAALAARRGPAAAVLDLDALGADAPAIVRAVRARLAKPARLLVIAHDEASALRAGAERSEVLLRPLDFLEAVRRVRGGAPQEARR
ncbi:MAG: response regulator, partial [Elusimicrobia bacterium]|nr:response regulator [Elusimicrobiota bacterium]